MLARQKPAKPWEYQHLKFGEFVLDRDGDLVGWSVVEVGLALVPPRRRRPPSSWIAHNCCMGSGDCILSCAFYRLNMN